MSAPIIKSQFFEDHNKDISFFYTGKGNVIGRDYADSVIANTRNAHYIRIATITYDETIQSTEENIINEEFLVRIENYISSQYLSNEITIKLTGHVVGKRVDKNNFKCIISPEFDYLDIPRIFITEERTVEENKIGIWLHTEGVKRIYLYKLYSHARNSYPLNTEYIDSKYYIEFLNNSDMTYNVDTSNDIVTITRNQFCAGINYYYMIDRRLSNLEAIRYPNIKFATINTDSSWTPITTGSSAVEYQKIPLINADYGLALSDSFLRVVTGTNHSFMVLEAGLYQVQFISGIITRSSIEDCNVELSIFKNDDIVNCTTMQFKLKADNGIHYTNPIGISSGTALLNLTETDLVKLQFKFIGYAVDGVTNDGTKILVTKLLNIP